MEWQGLRIPELEGFTGFVPPDGTGTYKVALIGEAPGEQEARSGKPFYPQAPAGAVLNRLLNRAGLDRDSFVISNSVWSRPPNNYLEGSEWEGRAIASYAPFRDVLFDTYRPRVLVALGNIALKTLTTYGGKGATITNVAGYVLDGPYDGTHVIGTYHPSYIMRGKQELSGVVIWALQRALDIARNGFVRLPTNYITHPSLEDAEAFERGYNPDRHILSWDIETPDSSDLDEEELEDKIDEISYDITRISFSYEKHHAITLVWAPPYLDVICRLLASHGPKRTWNGDKFDIPRVRNAGMAVNGKRFDVMDAWHFLQPTLPKGLAFVAPFYGWTGEPWKHLNHSEPEYYSCVDSDVLTQIADGVDGHLKQKGQYNIYDRHVVQLGDVLTKMSDNGLPYSKEKAQAFEAELQVKWDERFAELQLRVPVDLKPSKQKNGLVGKPRVNNVTITLPEPGPDVTSFSVGEVLFVRRKFSTLDEQMNVTQVERWCQVEPFLPTSWQQLMALIKFYGYKPGTNRKTKKETTEDDTLKKLLKKARASKKARDQEFALVLQMCRECRQLSKVLGTYVKGWRPGRDGRIHSTPGHWGKMFRVSWRRPNISATIQDKQEEYIAQGFRRCVATSDNRLLLESDWKGIEAVIVGWFANDADYMRLARLGVHDYMGIYMSGGTVDLSLSDAELKRLFKDFKREHPKLRDDAKHTVHGTNYGMGPKLMADMYELTERRARELQDLYFSLFPKIKEWQRSVLDRASRECKLRNPWGYEMSFWEVYRWDSKYQRWALGDDAKSAIAFLPRDTAAGMLKEVLLRLRYLADDGIMLASTHDSITCEVSESDLIRVATIVKSEMERPVKELNNLVIGVEQKAGIAWHDDLMEAVDIQLPTEEQALTYENFGKVYEAYADPTA